ncbi:hypothetical protein ABE354_08630 [Brevibacillus laterosporus]|uniref:hypothetical protein n=1 Tax=Brevibacillus laterosporus TaxID=1465 RepID=UPI003D19148E
MENSSMQIPSTGVEVVIYENGVVAGKHQMGPYSKLLIIVQDDKLADTETTTRKRYLNKDKKK